MLIRKTRSQDHPSSTDIQEVYGFELIAKNMELGHSGHLGGPMPLARQEAGWDDDTASGCSFSSNPSVLTGESFWSIGQEDEEEFILVRASNEKNKSTEKQLLPYNRIPLNGPLTEGTNSVDDDDDSRNAMNADPRQRFWTLAMFGLVGFVVAVGLMEAFGSNDRDSSTTSTARALLSRSSSRRRRITEIDGVLLFW